MRLLALLRLLIREIPTAGKGLLWRKFPLSRALPMRNESAAFASDRWIGFNTFHGQSKEFSL
jgi:hypothetical protein